MFAVLSGLDKSLKITDASPFYIVNFVVTAFGLLAVHKKHSKLLVIVSFADLCAVFFLLFLNCPSVLNRALCTCYCS